jgi:hypothetical protein
MISGHDLTERGVERVLEVGQCERLDEVRDGLQLERLPFGGKDAGEDDGPAERTQPACEGEPVGVPRLDHRRVHIGGSGTVRLREHGFVPGTSDDVLEERTDVGMRLDDQDPCHGRNIPRSRRYPVSLPV